MRHLLGIVVLVALAVFGKAASVTLIWEPSPDSNAVGYAIYYGAIGVPTPTRNDVGNVTIAPVNSLQPGVTYFFYVTAYDSAKNESDPSNVINYTVPAYRPRPRPPGDFKRPPSAFYEKPRPFVVAGTRLGLRWR